MVLFFSLVVFYILGFLLLLPLSISLAHVLYL